MKLNRTSAVVDYQLLAEFERLRDLLREPQFAPHWDKRLAYWALAGDRRLPLAFLDRTIRALIDASFEELHATPGVGQKKLHSLVTLLKRVVKDVPQDEPSGGETGGTPEPAVPEVPQAPAPVDAAHLSEATWAAWREAVKRHALEQETLGRFAKSLAELPKVIWETPLGSYVDLTLAEVRDLKTHGEKRLQAVLDVFHDLFGILSVVGAGRELTVRIVPRFASQLEAWFTTALAAQAPPTPAQIDAHFVEPLIEQLTCDTHEPIPELAKQRIGLSGTAKSVRDIAQGLGLTRARVYQMLGEAAAVMRVRWPEGPSLVHEMDRWIRAAHPGEAGFQKFLQSSELFFPQRRVGSEEPDASGEKVDFGAQRRAG